MSSQREQCQGQTGSELTAQVRAVFRSSLGEPQLALSGQSAPAVPFRSLLPQSWQAAHFGLLLPAVLALRME